MHQRSDHLQFLQVNRVYFPLLSQQHHHRLSHRFSLLFNLFQYPQFYLRVNQVLNLPYIHRVNLRVNLRQSPHLSQALCLHLGPQLSRRIVLLLNHRYSRVDNPLGIHLLCPVLNLVYCLPCSLLHHRPFNHLLILPQSHPVDPVSSRQCILHDTPQ
jgi:hypothetical protein